MSDATRLIAVPYDGSHATLFAAFDCGTTLPAQLAAEWIKGPMAIRSLRRGNKIWAYFGSSDALVGFGSLGTTKWSMPPPDGEKIELAFIPMLAIALEFQGKPVGCRCRDRFSGQLLSDLISKAAALQLPLLGLFCDPANVKAMAL